MTTSDPPRAAPAERAVPLGTTIRVGPAGWSYPDWEGRVYPRPHPRGFDPLAWLAGFVDCVEVNATFYAVPPPARVETWVRRVEAFPAFRFTAKLHRAFTHEPVAALDPGAVRDFLAAVAPLAEAGRLVALLAQFPWSFRRSADAEARLARLARGFRDLPLVCELRHRSWFDPEGLAYLVREGVGLAHVDLPAARDHPPPRHACVGPVGYVRLHGRNGARWFDRKATRDERYDYLYGPSELAGVVERLREVAGHSRETVLVTNNHYGGQAVANALEIRHLLDGVPPPAPEVLRSAFPHLESATRARGQQHLF